MDKNPIIIGRLIASYFRGDISEGDFLYLQKLKQDDENIRQLFESYRSSENFENDIDFLGQINTISAWETLQVKNNQRYAGKIRIRRYRWLGTVAASLILLFFTVKHLTPHDDRVVEDRLYGFKNDVLPGKEHAELILSNGKVVSLGLEQDSVKAGALSLLAENGLLYDERAQQATAMDQEQLFHTLRVPEAGTYSIELPDGSKVKMNSSSSLTYPVRFSNTKREVQLEGEAFFEVVSQKEAPFVVRTKQGQVQVLGTVFNVNSYDQGTTYVALVEGTVRVKNDKRENLLKPGELALMGNRNIRKEKTDLEKHIAWSGDYFYFSDDSISKIMTQLARWYGVDVTYKGDMSNKTLGGSIARNVTLGEALDMLNKVSGLTFSINGKKVTVVNK